MHSPLLSEHASSPDVQAAVASIIAGRRPLAGVSPQGVPKILAAWLEYWPGPATGLLEYLSGGKLRLQVTRPAPGQPPGKRTLKRDEQFRLRAGGVIRCNWREATLTAADGTIAAAVSLAWLPARLPWDTCTELDAGKEPAGRILDRLPGGMQRTDQRAVPAWSLEEITGQKAAVNSDAVIVVGGQRVALAEEWILREFAESLAG